MSNHPQLPRNQGGKIFSVGGGELLPTALRSALEAEGYVVEAAVNSPELFPDLELANPQLFILGTGVKNPDIFTLCREIRRTSHIPILALAKESSELDEAMFFAAGGDDFVVQSVSSRIFVLRIAALIRRSQSSSRESVEIMEAGGLGLNLITRKVSFEAGEISVTRTEFDLLKLLMKSPDKVFTRQEVISAIGGAGDFSNDHFLDTHASRLRLKIKDAGGPKVITAVRGVGYRLITNPSPGRSAGPE